MDLSIIIVSWNTKDLLEKCLQSIIANKGRLELEIFVVDNASRDGTAELIKTSWPQAILIANNTNRGFAAANNQAIKKARGRYILLLNPDTEIINGALTNMIDFMDRDQKIGIAGCTLLNPDATLQPSVRKFPTKTVIALLLTKIAKLWPNHPQLQAYFARGFDYATAKPVDQVMGAFFMINKKLIEDIGLLDQKFYIWFEEVDYCKRAWDAGWQVWYTPAAKIIHHGGQSFKQALTLKKQLLFFKSARHYLKKHAT